MIALGGLPLARTISFDDSRAERLGKTTITRWLRQVDFGEYINPDDIADELKGAYDARVAEAQMIADRRRDACLEAKRSFSFETVMSHPSKIEVLLRAKEAGFFVQLFFVGTDDPKNECRSRGATRRPGRARCSQGSHHRSLGPNDGAASPGDQDFRPGARL